MVPVVEESGFRGGQKAFHPHIKVPFPFLVILVLSKQFCMKWIVLFYIQYDHMLRPFVAYVALRSKLFYNHELQLSLSKTNKYKRKKKYIYYISLYGCALL